MAKAQDATSLMGSSVGVWVRGGTDIRAGEDESTSESFGKPAWLALGQPLQCTVVISSQQSLPCEHIIICPCIVLPAFQVSFEKT